jgi:hypothetical protein
MLPLPGVEGALVLGADQARAFKGDDISWARTIALRLSQALTEEPVCEQSL